MSVIRMSPSPSNRRSRLRVPCFVLAATFLAAILAAGAGADSVAPEIAIEPLPPAETWTDSGVEPALANERGRVRVRVVLNSQPLLAAAAASRFQRLAWPVGRGRQVSTPERSYDRAIKGLEDEAAAAAADVDDVAAAIEGLGGRVLAQDVLPAAVVARADVDLLAEIDRLAGVQAIEPAPSERSLSNVSVPAVGAPSWWSAGFTGGTGTNDLEPDNDPGGVDAVTIGEAAVSDHPAFAGVTLDNDPRESEGNHGTHVAGVLASQDATFRGVAHGLDRVIGTGSDAYALGILEGSTPGATDAAEVFNESFGGTGAEDSDNGVDVLVDTFRVSWAAGAGNSNVGGEPTVENVGRNILSVGGFNDGNTTASTDDVVLGISSRGPTPGGRKKPDLTAPGGSIISPDAGWNTPASNPDFTGVTGTSFSTPHVAGATALLEGSGITSPIAQRALLINSARDWDGTNTGLLGWSSGTQTGWRPEVGWGSLDLVGALAQRGNVEVGEVAEGEAAFYRTTAPADGKTTMAFELRGFFIGYPNPGTQTITYTQSNLDLRQYTAAGVEIDAPAPFDPPTTSIDPGPNAIDPNDTVEQTRTPSAQTVTFKVEAASTIDGAQREDFAIASAAPLQELEAPVTRPTGQGLSPPGTVACEEDVTVTTQLVNDSPDLDSTSSAVGLELPSGVDGDDGTQVVSGGTLEAGTTSETKSWTVRATSDGQRALTIAGVGQGLGTPFRREAQLILTSDCISPDSSIDGGPGGPTNDPTPAFSFSGSGSPTSFECSVDGAPFAACSSPFIAGPLPDGSHTFAVRSGDAVGNVDRTPATRAFVVDTEPPETSITSGPSGAIADRTPRFGLASSDGPGGFACSVDDAPFEPCSDPATVGPLAQGAHRFAAVATDAAGNADPTPAARSFGVDTLVSGEGLGGKARQPFLRELDVMLRARMGEPGRVTVKTEIRGTDLRARARTVRAAVSPGGSRRLLIRASPATDREIARALQAGEVTVVARARFTDELGNQAKRKRNIQLR